MLILPCTWDAGPDNFQNWEVQLASSHPITRASKPTCVLARTMMNKQQIKHNLLGSLEDPTFMASFQIEKYA